MAVLSIACTHLYRFHAKLDDSKAQRMLATSVMVCAQEVASRKALVVLLVDLTDASGTLMARVCGVCMHGCVLAWVCLCVLKEGVGKQERW
jgi:hypothetical protein